MTVVVEDDGKGFDPDTVRPEALGLLGMRERLALLDGTLAIESAPGKGSTFIGFVPTR